MSKKGHSLVQNGPDRHSVLCGETTIANIHEDATGKHFVNVEPGINLQPTDLAFMLDRVLFLEQNGRIVQ